MIPPFDSVDALARERPEWAAWLGVVRIAIEALGDRAWSDTRVSQTDEGAAMPALARSTLHVDARAAQKVVADAFRAAGHAHGEVDAVAVLGAALNRDRRSLEQHARHSAIDPALFASIASLAALPLLHACGLRYGVAKPPSWTSGHCPVCAGWPAFVEARGIERRRFYRCGDCATAWESAVLSCAYCGTTDHEKLGVLVPGKDGSGASIETCGACSGYIKVFTVLGATPAAQVVLRDLASAELDIAAAERGYLRPREPACALELKVSPG